MALHDDLLAHAQLLAAIDTGIPAQANLRRCISATYYAIFHLLISEATTHLVSPHPRGLRERVGRSFSHGEMKQVCLKFAAKRTSDDLTPLLFNGVPSELFFLANVFCATQEARHKADYDLAVSFLRPEVARYIDQAQRAFTAWQSIRLTEEANVFLTALAFGARWSK